MEDRFAQIGQEFDENRDSFYRQRLHSFQIDTDYIRNADLYANKPLDDLLEDAPEGSFISAAGSTQGSVRALNFSKHLAHDKPLRPGAHAAQFTHAINNAIEQRDADLTTVAYRHNHRISELLKDSEFSIAVAHTEHQRLLDNLRRRLTQNLNQKKAALQREKEKLDIADTNSLLYHPTQFNFNNGGSPGGPQSNRKTRHTRHRLEIEDLEAANGSNKRKRKAPVDLDNGSPAPAGREMEPANILKEANLKLECQQLTFPVYSLDRLFTQRELDTNLQLATYEVIEDLKRRRLNNQSNTTVNSIVTTNVDSSESEDNAETGGDADGPAEEMLLQASEMERIPTNTSQHLTRSTRGLLLPNQTVGPEGLGYLAGRAAGVITIVTAGQRDKKKEDDHHRAPGLTDPEAANDLVMMKAAIANEDAGKSDELLMDAFEEVHNYVGTGSTQEEEARNEEF